MLHILKPSRIETILYTLGICALFAKVFCSFQGRGTFPCEISVLEIHQDLDWNPKVSTLNVWPLYICDDGAVIFYRYIFLCL